MILAPPISDSALSPVPWNSSAHTAAICAESSRPGVTMRTWTAVESGLSVLMVGRRNARVLPEPVGATTTTSSPLPIGSAAAA